MRPSLTLVLIAVLALALSVIADQGRKLSPEQEINERARAADAQIWHLNSNDFDTRIMQGTWLIFFGMVQVLQEAFPTLAWSSKPFCRRRSPPEKLHIAKVDCTDVDEWCAARKADAYPSLYLYHNGQYVEEFMGEHESTDIYQYILQKIAFYKESTEANVVVEKKEEPIVISKKDIPIITTGVTISSTTFKPKPSPGQAKTHAEL
ncbi:hypothetical protein BC829DRAFT_445404 [Chytridium lagenaria]|nr:hypothetical protein BC829DRAFT_445404 [Chytridium lagenaria]